MDLVKYLLKTHQLQLFTGRPVLYGHPIPLSCPDVRLSTADQCFFNRMIFTDVRASPDVRSLDVRFPPEVRHFLYRTLFTDFRSSTDDRTSPVIGQPKHLGRPLAVCWFVACGSPASGRPMSVRRPDLSVPADVRSCPDVRRLLCT